MTSKSDVVVQVRRRFDASCERVFDAWLNPTALGHWMFGPEVRDEEIERLEVDARVGGKFSFVVRRGNEQIDHVGEYEAIERPHRLGFTWSAHAVGKSADESTSHVSIEITPCSGGCELALTHKMDRKWANYAERTQAGWTTMLVALDRHLATNH